MNQSAETDILRLHGGVPLEGSVPVRGSKNSVPKTMVAALLTPEPCRISNVADIRDITIVAELVEALGGGVDRQDGELGIAAPDLLPPGTGVLAAFHERSRIPILTCAPLLHRCGSATIHQPGGCSIGTRPVDMHLKVLTAFGASVDEVAGGLQLRVARMRGAAVELPYPSVGATEQFLLAAAMAEGDSELRNAAVEPEILDLAAVLQKMGALVSVLPGRILRVSGVGDLRGFTHRSMTDRLEAASWAAAALATSGRITVHGADQADLMTFLNLYRRAGGDFDVADDAITFYRAGDLVRPLAFETDVHPGFMTDWHPPLVTALTQADGVSVLHETVFEDRLGYTGALNQLGANIQTFRECLGPMPCRFGSRNWIHSAVVIGPSRLRGGELTVPDLRAGCAYVLAALAADGPSTIYGASYIDRGYENFRAKLADLGAKLL